MNPLVLNSFQRFGLHRSLFDSQQRAHYRSLLVAMSSARIALMLVVVVALSAYIAAAQTLCPSVDTGALAFACDGACERGQPCMAPSPTNLTAGCRCFTINKRIPSDYVAFQFLVPFDTTTTAALKQASPASYEKISGYNDTTSVAWASNSELTKIAPMSLSPVTTSVYVIAL